MANRGIRSLLTPLTVVVLIVAVAGCSSEGDDAKKKKKKKDLPPARVDLPEPPPASEFEITEKNSDGTFRVRGLIAHKGKHLGEKVTIKGTVTYLSPDCDPAVAEKKGEECPKPYLYIRDEEEGDAKMMVVGYDQEFVDRADLEEGETYEFEGTYKKLAQGFVATEDGLLLVDRANDTEAVEEDGR